MATAAPAYRPLLPPGRSDPMVDIGIAPPRVRWSLTHEDRKKGVMIAGGQGSGKSATLQKIVEGDVLSPNTATIVFDMKGSLAERLLRMIPADLPKRYFDHSAQIWREGTKRVWYLDLADPAFGLTPLHVEPGWTLAGLPNEFVRIAGMVVHALMDLFEDQIYQSSQDIIERSVIGTMAIASFEHNERHRKAATNPEQHGFGGSFEVLHKMLAPTDRLDPNAGDRRAGPKPNPWHQAAGRACQQIPGLRNAAEMLLYELPALARNNLTKLEDRMMPAANKLGPLVTSHAAVRDFVGHPSRLSLRSVIEAHDILIINPRTDILGQDSPTILVNFLVHMIDAQLDRQISMHEPTRPRVSLLIDEAHTVITKTLMQMTSRHREAGFCVAAATQYLAQIGASIKSTGIHDYVIDAVANLLQTKIYFRMADPVDAEAACLVGRPVHDSMVRGDPVSQARMAINPASLMALEDYIASARVMSNGQWSAAPGATTALGGTTALPVFTHRSIAVPALHLIATTWRDLHHARMRELLGDAQRSAAIRDAPPLIPEGLGGPAQAPPVDARDRDEAAQVARDTVGRQGTRPRGATDASTQEWHSVRPSATDDARSVSDQPPVSEREPQDVAVGGARVERSPPRSAPPIAPAIELFDWAMRPTDRPAPREDLPALPGVVADAVAYAASVEQLTALGEWKNAADGAIKDAEAATRAARSAAALEARAEGMNEQKIEAAAATAGNAARRRELAKHADAAWQRDIAAVTLSTQEQHILEVLARLPLSAPPVIAALINKRPKERRLRQLIRERLHDQGLISASALTLERRGGRPPTVYAVSARGREWLRLEHQKLRGDQPPPDYLRPDRNLPAPGRGSTVPHTLAVQLVLGALRQFGGTDVKTIWWTPMMPGGRLDVGMAHTDRRDKHIRLEDLTGRVGLTVIGDALSAAPGVVEPDVTVQMTGHVAGQRRSLSMLLEIDRTDRASYNTEKLIAYDHFLAGWCVRTRAFARARPLVVFVARSPRSALRLLARASDVMTVGVGISGHDRQTYQYYGRTHTAFTCIDWILGGQAYALRMAPMPPERRDDALLVDAEAVALLPEAWWPKKPTSAAGTPR
ncbi:MAG: type IV secretory system conjugative DNA transfer family protein [Actinomycetota bacterium]|nr:type IV secretory system conjugative DNA transfer family protein [Actinomycetota bacterium]